MRPPIIRARFEGELVVDNFAGGGGASTGIASALGRPCDIAINHDPKAIAMHKANHPETKHFVEDIWEVDPKEACGGRPVGLAWFSPDCTHFSRAKGGKPVKKEIRALANVVIKWAEAVHPRVIILENVEEFKKWGPLRKDNRPDKRFIGRDYRQWRAKLTDLGYKVEDEPLVAADYGTPTTRKRLFLIARLDGTQPIWPDPTHGEGRQEEWIPAAEIIDWSLACPSIFERKKPLVVATLRRIAEGIRRFVVETDDPFIIPLTHHGKNRGYPIDEPLRTVTAAHRGEFALVSPTLIQASYGERPGQAPRVPGLHKPLGTVVAGGCKHALVATFMAQHYGRSVGRPMSQPVGTVTAGGGGHHALVTAFISKHNGGPHGGAIGNPMSNPTSTVTAKDQHAITCAFLTKFYKTAIGSSCRMPTPTVTAGAWGGHLGEVRAFLLKYYGSGTKQMQAMGDPLHTVTSKARFGLVTVQGQPYRIVDVGMRMLQPHELFAAQGFPEGYNIRPEYNGKPITKTAQISLAGNAVPPQWSEAIVSVNAAA